MVPHLVKWDQAYRSKGLVILDINNGAIDTRSALDHYVKKSKKTYPVLWDQGGKTCRSYAVRAYPTAFLIGPDGKVLWSGIPLQAGVEALEKRIQKALKTVDLEALKKKDSPFLRTKPGELPKAKATAGSL
jgi:hypothetical protein